MTAVWFVDTSVFVNILGLDGYSQDRAEVIGSLKRKSARREVLILPITAVIETGNHIAHLGDGSHRRDMARLFVEVLGQMRDGTAPWQLHSVAWDDSFLDLLINGASTGADLVTHAQNQMGCGDLCIVAECELYRRRVGRHVDVRVWSLDQHLAAYG